MKKVFVLIALVLFSSLVLADLVPIGSSTIQGYELPSVTEPTTPGTPPVLPPVVPPTDDEFKWIPNVPIKDVKLFLDVNSTLISNEMVEVCWKYPDAFEPKLPDGAKKFEAIFFEEPTSSGAPTKDFKLAFEIDASKSGWKSKCVPIQATPPTVQTAYAPTADFGGQLYPDYSKIDPNASNGLNRRTLVVSGYYSNSTFVPAKFKMGGEIVYFAVGTTDNKGYSGTINLAIVENADGAESEVWVSTQTPLGISFQKSARTAAKIAQEMNPALPKYSYFFKIADSQFGSVDGSSAGAVMTVLASKTLKKEAIKKNVGITGTIEFDGKIGRIGGVNEKASAANSLGTSANKFTFLVPTGQKSEITTAYPSIESKEVANIQAALNEFQTEEGFTDAGFLPDTVGTGMNALIWGIAPKIVDERSVKQKLAFSNVIVNGESMPIVNNLFVFDSSSSNKTPQPFELQLEGVQPSKVLYLGVGDSTVCGNIVKAYNDGKIALEPSKLDKVKSWAAEWLPTEWFTSGSQVEEGVRRVKAGEWLEGSVQVTGAELTKVVIAGLKGVFYLGKGIVVTAWHGGKAAYYEAVEEISGSAPFKANKDDSTQGIPIKDLLGGGTADESKYLVINAISGNLYIKGSKELPEFRAFLWLLKKIDNLDVNPTNFKDGKEVKFFACQFDLDKTDTANPKLSMAGKDEATVRFGSVSCTSILDCLAKIDQVFISKLFGSS